MIYFPIPENEEWHVQVLQELLNYSVELSGSDKKEMKDFINFICTTESVLTPRKKWVDYF